MPAKHTPGPWHIKNAQGRLPNIRPIRNRPEATRYMASIGAGDNLTGPLVVRLDFGYGSPTDEANAELLAASPELKEALRSLANEASGFLSMADREQHGYTNCACLKQRIDAACALLSRIDGEDSTSQDGAA